MANKFKSILSDENNHVTHGNVRIVGGNESSDQGIPWIRSNGDYLVLNAVDGNHVYLNWDSTSGGSGHVHVSNGLYAQAFYDRLSTSYYLDPGNTGISLKTAGRAEATQFRGGVTASGDGDDNQPFALADDYSSWAIIFGEAWTNNNGWGIFWAGNDNPAYSYWSTTNPNEAVFVGGGNVRASIDLDNGASYFGNQVRSPIFYDSDNTGYYVNPAGTSVMNDIEIDDYIYHKGDTDTYLYFESDSIKLRTGGDDRFQVTNDDAYLKGPVGINTTDPDGQGYSFAEDLVILGGNSASDGVGLTLRGNGKRYGVIAFGDNADDNPGEIYYDHNNDHMYFRTGTNVGLEISSGNVVTASDIRSTIFYDSNNTAYYVNPAGTSRLGFGIFDGYDGASGNNARLSTGISLGRFSSEYAYIEIASSNNSGGWIDFNQADGTDYLGRIRYYNSGAYMSLYAAATEQFRVYSTYTISTTSSRAPIFYDSNNTAYYVNPADYSLLNGITMYTAGATDTGSVHLGRGAFITFYGNSNSHHGIGSRDTSGNLTDDLRINSYHNVHINLDSNNNNSTESSVFTIGHHGQGTGTVANTGFSVTADGIATAASDMRAPVFYDSDDTTYFLNPSMGQMRLGVTNNFSAIETKGSGGYLSLRVTDGGHSDGWGWSFTDQDVSATSFTTYLRVNYNGTATSSSVVAAGSFRAPIFYDSNNTGYYVDPNGTSSLYGLNISQTISGTINDSLRLVREDNRTISPSELTAGRLKFGFTSFGNNNTSPYADFLHMRSYTDSSGGHDNLLMFKKAATSKVRLYTQSFGSATAYSSYMDLLDTSGDDQVKTGYIQSNDSLRSPIFYDSGNTAYYVDPSNGANGISANLQGRIQVGTFNQSQTNTGEAWIGRAADRSAGDLTVQLGTGTGRKFEVVDYGWTTVEFEVNDSGTAFAAGDFRAPIFYDSNNTGYYVDPNSTSKLYDLTIERGEVNNQKIDFKSTSTAGYSALRFSYNSTEQNTIHAFGSTWSSSTWPGNSAGAINLSGYNGVTIGSWSSPGAWIYNDGEAQFQDSVRSPIFYDSDNTSYSLTPDSSATGQWQVNTPSGYVRIGAGNGSYSHFYTDRGKFYFNKEVTVDTGVIQSYNEDLLLRRLESNTDYIIIRDTSIGFFLDTVEDMRLENDGDLHVEGDVIAYSTTISDKALKDNVLTLENSLDKVSKLRGVEYTWNNTSRKGQKDIGVIAQEVEEVIPEIVREKEMALIDGGKYKTVDYEKLTAVLIEAVKELKQEVEQLKNKCNDCTC